jgi:hypothetical protein
VRRSFSPANLCRVSLHVVAVFGLDPPFVDLDWSSFPPSWIVQGSDTAENQKKTRMEGAVSLDA